MRLSVLLATYQQPEWLEKVLLGLSVQSWTGFELLIADDGSGPDTARVIERLGPAIPGTVRHLRHDDQGFRKCVILNRAIVESAGDYLVFLDGDCIPRRDFLAVHRALARPGRFLSGGAFRLSQPVSRSLTADDITSGRAFEPRWLRGAGVPWSRRLLRLGAGPRTAALLDRLTTTRASFNGGNASVWRADALRVGGFDERMGHGGLDREFGERLHHAGLRGHQIRHRAVVLHLDHPRGYRNPDTVRRNREIWDETVATRRVRTDHGIPSS